MPLDRGYRTTPAHAGAVLLLATAALAACATSSSAPAPARTSAVPVSPPALTRSVAHLSTGLDLAYVSTGPSDGPTLLLLHGLTNDADAWSRVMSEVSDRMPGLRIVAIDLRGHGQSSKPADPAAFTIPSMARDVVAFMDAVGIERASIAGHSMGSLIAQDIALTHPDRVDKLVLISSTANAQGAPILGSWLLDDVIQGQWRTSLAAQGVAWPQPALSRTPLDADPDAVAWMRTYWNVYPLTPDRDTTDGATRAAGLPLATWLGATEGIMAFDRRQQLTSLTTPVLVLWGTQDAFFLRADQDVLITALRSATRTGGSFRWKQYGRLPLPADGLQADDIGHNLTWDAPVPVAEDIASFLENGEPSDTEWYADAPSSKKVVGKPGAATIVRN
ncbi:MAG: alpha/beta hydrolase [Actinobacteria bacterium]|nr:alpha/beta hydrolase [Actinomycetota bacterium]